MFYTLFADRQWRSKGNDMDKVLVVDDDPKELVTFQEWFKVLYHFDVSIASDGEKAIDILKKGDISVFCTGMNIPKVGGLELLAYVSRHYPEMPCIVLSEFGVPWFPEKQNRQAVLYYVEKPVHPEALATAIFVGLVLNDEGVAFKGISVRSYLPLVWESQKTCVLNIESRKKGSGTIYFSDGQIIDASYKDLSAKEAVVEMSRWEKIKFEFSDLPEEMRGKSSNINMMGLLDISWRAKRPKKLPAPAPTSLTISKDQPDIPPRPEKKEKPLYPQDKLKKILRDAGQTLRGIQGYQAAGILNTEWEVLAEDTVKDIDFSDFSELMQTMVATSSDVIEKKNIGKCQSLTLHTQKHTVILLNTGKSYQVVIVMAPGSNWYFAKCRVEGGF